MIKKFLLSLFLSLPLLTGGQILSTIGAGSSQGFGQFHSSSSCSPHGVVVITTTGSSAWQVPSCVSHLNSIEAIGSGGRSGAGGGGGGGAYAITTSLTVTPLQTVYLNVSVNAATTWANISSNTAPTSTAQGVLADFGLVGTSSGANGGQAANCIGNTTFSGGAGGAPGSSSAIGGGGGGAAGPGGAGQNGGAGNTTLSGGGGGAAGGSAGASAGQAGQTSAGGNGGGTNGGAGATSSVAAANGTLGGGGGGGFNTTNTGAGFGSIFPITAWTGGTYGPAGGSGGKGASGQATGLTTNYGSGEGGAGTSNPNNGKGIIVITY